MSALVVRQVNWPAEEYPHDRSGESVKRVDNPSIGIPTDICPKNETWYPCKPRCPLLCENLLKKCNRTTKRKRCKSGCDCRYGFVRSNGTSPCVSVDHCLGELAVIRHYRSLIIILESYSDRCRSCDRIDVSEREFDRETLIIITRLVWAMGSGIDLDSPPSRYIDWHRI